MKNEKFLTDILNQISVGGFPEKLQEVLQKEMAFYVIWYPYRCYWRYCLCFESAGREEDSSCGTCR